MEVSAEPTVLVVAAKYDETSEEGAMETVETKGNGKVCLRRELSTRVSSLASLRRNLGAVGTAFPLGWPASTPANCQTRQTAYATSGPHSTPECATANISVPAILAPSCCLASHGRILIHLLLLQSYAARRRRPLIR